MSSRISDDIADLFICFYEIAKPKNQELEPESIKIEVAFLQTFPDSYKDEKITQEIPNFVYPCEFETSTVQHFSFVLTNIDSKWTFGFCRYDPKTLTTLVFLSYLPWHEVFFRLLNTVADLIRECEVKDLTNFLEFLHQTSIPEPGAKFSVRLNEKIGSFNCKIPDQHNLPHIPESRNLTEYYNAVDKNNMIEIFASMLHERRIVIKSRKPHVVSACVQAANTIIYPMNWQHIFIPLLPRHLTDYLLAPMPFFIGIPSSTWDNVKKSDIGDVVLLDTDTNIMETPFRDSESLPADVVKFLKTQMKNQAAMSEDGLARTFLKAMVLLIGGYRDALKFQEGQQITFNPEAFVMSRPPSYQPFLRKMLQLQIFVQFKDERLDILNAGLGFTDEFERVASSNVNDQYNNWVATMKKTGTAFFKSVKSKTNPAVRSAVKTVKEKGKDVKSAYKGIRTRMRKEGHGPGYDHNHGMRTGGSTSTFHRARPLTVGSSTVATTTYKKQRVPSVVANSRSNEYVPLNSPTEDQVSPTQDDEIAAPSLNMDLLGDLQDVLNRQCSLMDSSPPVDRTLKPVRSLDGSSLPGRDWPDDWVGAVPSAVRSSFPSQVPNVLKPVRAPRSPHPPLSRPSLSLPLSSPSSSPITGLAHTNPFAFTFPTYAPILTDPFGFSAFPSETTTPKSNDIANSFRQPLGNASYPFPLNQLVNVAHIVPPPQPSNCQQPTNSKCNGTADLIRLDSTSSHNEDNISRENSDDSIKFKTGLMNPLYPYYTPINNASSSTSVSRTTNGIWEPPPKPIQNNTSFVHSSQSVESANNFNEQDIDLLKEYGIEFKSTASPVAKANCRVPTEPLDPFELPFEASSVQRTPSTWATFD